MRSTLMLPYAAYILLAVLLGPAGFRAGLALESSEAPEGPTTEHVLPAAQSSVAGVLSSAHESKASAVSSLTSSPSFVATTRATDYKSPGRKTQWQWQLNDNGAISLVDAAQVLCWCTVKVCFLQP